MGLRKLGVDSRLFDPIPSKNPVYPGGVGIPTEDRGCPIDSSLEWALEADVIVSHSGHFGSPFEKTSQPIAQCLHGRPQSTFLSERDGRGAIITYYNKINEEARTKAAVTFWPEHVPYHEVTFTKVPVHNVGSMVDLDWWKPGLDAPHTWNAAGGGGGGWFNAVFADGFRDDADGFRPISAWALWSRKNPGAKFHCYGRPQPAKGFDAILGRCIKEGTIGEYRPWMKQEYLRSAYNSADCLMTPHRIATRAIREAMATGCPVAYIGDDLKFEPPTQTRAEARAMAEKMFDPEVVAKRFKAILESLA